MEQTRNTTESIMKSEVLIIVFCILFAQSACAAPSVKSVKEDNTVKETDFKVCCTQSIFTF